MELNEIPIEDLSAECRRRSAKAHAENWPKRLRDVREWIGIDQQEAAKFLSYSQAYVCLSELGKRPIAERLTLMLIEKCILTEAEIKCPRA